MVTKIEEILKEFSKLYPKHIDLSLERITRLLNQLGNPQLQFQTTIHVAGTNGKGSTLSFLRSICEAKGLRVHTYTSPHLVNIEERFRIATAPGASASIPSEMLSDVLRTVLRVNDGAPITVFEALTVAAYIVFAQVPADLVLVETGLGGRLDATNVLKPDVTAITTISLDHKEYLGERLESIAKEKAGIFKPGIPAIVGVRQDHTSWETIHKEACKIKAQPFISLGQHFDYHVNADCVTYRSQNVEYVFPQLGLKGNHQYHNASLALAILGQVKAYTFLEKEIQEGLTHTRWQGRLEQIDQVSPSVFPECCEVWMDGAHNKEGATVVAQELALMKRNDNKATILICGISRSKDPSEILQPYLKTADLVVTLQLPNPHLSYSAEELSECAHAVGFKRVVKQELSSVHLWMREELTYTCRVLITGSLYLIGAFKELDQNSSGMQKAFTFY